MTIALKVSALPAPTLDRIRDRGIDDFGNPLVTSINQEAGGTPLRCCLQEAAVGEEVSLLAWCPAPKPGPYAETGPVFVHAGSCPGWSGSGYPEGFRHRSQLLRAYNEAGWAVDNQLIQGQDAEVALQSLLTRPDVAYVHSRNPMAGCYMFAVTAAVDEEQ
jgi:hypothetical protein